MGHPDRKRSRQTDLEGNVKTFPNRELGGVRPAGALFLDRQAGLVREICSRSIPSVNIPLTTVRRSLDRLREVGASIGVASHNRADSWESFNTDEITVMNRRIEAALGPIDLWCVCLIGTDGSCACSEPAAGVLMTGAQAVGIRLERSAVLSEDGRMADAVESAGASSVPHPPTDGVPLAKADERLVLAAEELARVVDAFLTIHELESGRGPETGCAGASLN